MGYAHVARGVRLDNKGRLKFEDSSKDVLGEGREVTEVISVSFVLQGPLPECVVMANCDLQQSTVQLSLGMSQHGCLLGPY